MSTSFSNYQFMRRNYNLSLILEGFIYLFILVIYRYVTGLVIYIIILDSFMKLFFHSSGCIFYTHRFGSNFYIFIFFKKKKFR